MFDLVPDDTFDDFFHEKSKRFNESFDTINAKSIATVPRIESFKSSFYDSLFDNLLFPYVSKNDYFNDFVGKKQSKIEILQQLGVSINDLALLKGKGFRIGWSNNFEMISLNQKITNNNLNNFYQTFLIQKRPDFITDIVNCRTICRQKISTPAISYECLERNVLTQLKFVKMTESCNLPKFEIKTDRVSAFNLLNEQLEDFQNTTYDRVWKLIHTLWSDIPMNDEQTYLINLKRKELLTEWLEETIIEKMSNEIDNFLMEEEREVKLQTILTYLVSNRISEAAKHAFDSNFINLSLLISQINSSEEFRVLMRSQLQKWIQFRIYKHMPRTLLKIYMLLAGEMSLGLPDYEFVNACEDFDWKTVFSCHLWYFSDSNSTIRSALDLYDCTMKNLNKNSNPEYRNDDSNTTDFDDTVKDVSYYLLKMFCDNSYSLDVVLNPLNYGRDAFDFQFAWYLMVILRSFQCSSISKHFELFLIKNFANQLEANGFWHIAVYVLLFLDNGPLKQNLFWNLLKRNLSTNSKRRCAKEVFLLRHLNISDEIIAKIKSSKINDFQDYTVTAWL